MGKGLSPLQKSILQIAFKVSPKRAMTKDDVLEKVWGWEPVAEDHKLLCHSTSSCGYSFTYERELGYRKRFASELVGGKGKYQSIHASTARSIRRLVERGLLKGSFGHYQPYRITPKGKKVWQELKAKEE